jgi:hypothetical protein
VGLWTICTGIKQWGFPGANTEWLVAAHPQPVAIPFHKSLADGGSHAFIVRNTIRVGVPVLHHNRHRLPLPLSVNHGRRHRQPVAHAHCHGLLQPHRLSVLHWFFQPQLHNESLTVPHGLVVCFSLTQRCIEPQCPSALQAPQERTRNYWVGNASESNQSSNFKSPKFLCLLKISTHIKSKPSLGQLLAIHSSRLKA